MYSTINLTTDPNQQFTTTIPVDGNNLTLKFSIYWNNIAQYWCMDIIDTRVNKQVVTAIPLLESLDLTQNILGQYAYLAIGSAYLVNVSNASGNPDTNNMGTDYILLWGDTP